MASEETDLPMVIAELSQLPIDMVKFSTGLRTLYSTNQVSANDEGTRKFLKIRDDVRKNAIVYAQTVLPVTEEVTRSIGNFADNFNDLTYDDWSENLDDILEELDESQIHCEILRGMHNTIIQDLMKSKESATVGKDMMKEMSKKYEEAVQKMNITAAQLTLEANSQKSTGIWTGLFTFGISTILYYSSAREKEREAKTNAAEAVANARNKEIALHAVGVTEGILIPAVHNFMRAVENVRQFLVETKENLAKMQKSGDNAKAKEKKKIYYQKMKARSMELSQSCMTFLKLSDMMRNNLTCIPDDPSDKNYVDKWLEHSAKIGHFSWHCVEGQVEKIGKESFTTKIFKMLDWDKKKKAMFFEEKAM